MNPFLGGIGYVALGRGVMIDRGSVDLWDEAGWGVQNASASLFEPLGVKSCACFAMWIVILHYGREIGMRVNFTSALSLGPENIDLDAGRALWKTRRVKCYHIAGTAGRRVANMLC